MDAIAHVVRVFADSDVASVSGKIDPLGDVDVIELELALADLQVVDKRMEKTTRMLKTGERIYKGRVGAAGGIQAGPGTGHSPKAYQAAPNWGTASFDV